MATPCEIRIETTDRIEAETVGGLALVEAKRIEQKFSRYRDDSIVSRINNGNGRWVGLDSETGLLLRFAADVYLFSEGLFDITSGVMRRAWRFDGSGTVPSQASIDELLSKVGWSKVSLGDRGIRMPKGMEIDLGGLAKEYAVDRALGLIKRNSGSPVLVNFGGDLAVSKPRVDGSAWNVAIEGVDKGGIAAMLALRKGAIATSGDARRFIVRDGIRYGHIIDPRSGWPVKAPLGSVSVAAATCVEAGVMSTLAILHGDNGRAFLSAQGAISWVIP